MTDTVQIYELVWVALALSTLSQHARALLGYRRERKDLKRLGVDELTDHLVNTSVGLESFLLVVQQFFLTPGLMGLFRPEAPGGLTVARLTGIGFLLAGQTTLNIFSRWHSWRHRTEIRMAKESHELDPATLEVIAAEFKTDSGSTLRDLAERMEDGIKRLEAKAEIVAANLKESEARADAVENGEPGEAADAASQSEGGS